MHLHKYTNICARKATTHTDPVVILRGRCLLGKLGKLFRGLALELIFGHTDNAVVAEALFDPLHNVRVRNQLTGLAKFLYTVVQQDGAVNRANTHHYVVHGLSKHAFIGLQDNAAHVRCSLRVCFCCVKVRTCISMDM